MKEKKNIIVYLAFEFISKFCLIEQFFSSYLSDCHYSLTWISGLLMVYQVTKFVFEIPTGYVSDKYGRKASGCIGMVLLIVSYILLLAKVKVSFVASFFIRGLSLTFISGSIESIAVESISATKLVKLNVIRRIFFFVATASAALLAGMLIKYKDYNVVIIIDIIASMVALLLVLSVEEKKYYNDPKKAISLRDSLGILYRNKAIMLFLFMDFIYAFSFIGVENLYPAYLKELGVGADVVGIFISVQLIVSSMCGLFIPQISKVISKEIILYIFPVLSVVVVVFVYALEIPIICIPVLLTIHYILFAIYSPIKYSVFQQEVRDEYRATFISYSSQAIAFGGICFYLFSGLLGQVLNMRMLILVALVVTLCFICVCCYQLWNIDALNIRTKKICDVDI